MKLNSSGASHGRPIMVSLANIPGVRFPEAAKAMSAINKEADILYRFRRRADNSSGGVAFKDATTGGKVAVISGASLSVEDLVAMAAVRTSKTFAVETGGRTLQRAESGRWYTRSSDRGALSVVAALNSANPEMQGKTIVVSTADERLALAYTPSVDLVDPIGLKFLSQVSYGEEVIVRTHDAQSDQGFGQELATEIWDMLIDQVVALTPVVEFGPPMPSDWEPIIEGGMLSET